MNVLGVDPQNLKYDFARDWAAFRTGKVHKFLRFYLEMRVRLGQARLEKVSPAELGLVQGEVQAFRQVLTVLEKESATEQLTEVIKFLDDYGK